MADEDDKKEASAPVMNRSRNQLATAYAPGAFFTFEGGLGACITLPDPDATFDRAQLPDSARKQIILRLQEITRSWFNRAMSCQRSAKNPVHPRMCVDEALLHDDRIEPLDISRIEFVNPVKMAYAPAPLTFVCNTCQLFRGFESVREMERYLGQFDPGHCPHPKHKDRCQWRQLDVIFVHWSGNWGPAIPGMYEWDSPNERLREPIRQCVQCGSRDFLLNGSSPSIGKWFFQCASCGHRARDTWLQNDPDTLDILRDDFSKRVTEGRMEPISYRASAAFYPQFEQFIIFDEKDEGLLSIFDPTRQTDLESFIAEHFGYGGMRPPVEQMETLLEQGGMGPEWEKYTHTLKMREDAKTMAESAPENMRSGLRKFVERFDVDLRDLVESWFTKGYLKETNELPDLLKASIANRTAFSSRYDPFTLAVEHEALRRNKLDQATDKSGRRAFVRFTALDKTLAPAEESKKEHIQRETRQLLDRLGIAESGIIREFDLCRFTYGYTRVQAVPSFEKRGQEMPVRLNLFPSLRDNKKPVYVVTQANEAIYVQLKSEEVYAWLQALAPQDRFEWCPMGKEKLGARLLERAIPFGRFLANLKKDGPALSYIYVYTLLHTYAHVLMKAIAEHSGLDLGSLGEYLFPADLAFVVYRNGTTMDLGNLSSLWRNENVRFLKHLLHPHTLSCNSGSLCEQSGGACPDCIMVPETSCIAQNQLLGRSVLCGGEPPREDGDHRHQRIKGFLESVNGGITG